MAVLRERDGSKMGHFSTVRTLTLERKFYQVALLFFLCLYCGLPLWLSWLRIHPQCGRPGFDPWVGKTRWRKRLPTPGLSGFCGSASAGFLCHGNLPFQWARRDKLTGGPSPACVHGFSSLRGSWRWIDSSSHGSSFCKAFYHLFSISGPPAGTNCHG